jgi:1-deoxy-D-xylulose-5-phosphate reductoisomerase
VAVAAFLAGRLGFTGIPGVIDAVLAQHSSGPASSLETVLGADAWARERAESLLVGAARSRA